MIESQNSPGSKDGPLIPASVTLPEITIRALILGTILTIILAAANAYLGLKIGNTVSASIPAAVISMGILRFFRDSNVLENTMVQIMASVGESLTAGIAYILPALLILHIWTDFNYWQTVATGLLGGGLGVLFTIPLRRALLQDKSLRYPEAVAIGNVLKAGTQSKGGDLNALVKGGVIGSAIALFQTGFQVLRDSFDFWVMKSNVVFGFGLGLSPALIGAGYIVGVNVAVSLLVGVMIGWIGGVPVLSWIYGIPASAANGHDVAMFMWQHYIRYIGVGTMLVGGLWTLCTLFKPVVKSMATSFLTLQAIKLGKKESLIRTEFDIPITYVAIATLILLIPIFFMIALYVVPSTDDISANLRYFISAFSTLYILFGGFVFCSVMAYFAGLIGSTNSPASGLLVSALLVISIIFLGFFSATTLTPGLKESLGSIVAIGSLVIIGAALAIANDTMQDLKVGEIVGATPWKQQVMLILGVIVSAFVIPPILQLLFHAYGIGGVFPREGMDPSQMLAAPQAGLMAAVAKGVFTHTLEWGMIIFGAIVAIVCIIVDEILKRNYGTRLPVLAVGLGIYLPLDSCMPVIIGGFLSYLIHWRLNRKYPEPHSSSTHAQMNVHRHRGLLLACGMVAGASLMGVLLAIPFAISQSTDVLALMPKNLAHFSHALSLIVTAIMCAWIYKYVMSKPNDKSIG